MGWHAYKRHVLRIPGAKRPSVGRLLIQSGKSLESEKTPGVGAVERVALQVRQLDTRSTQAWCASNKKRPVKKGPVVGPSPGRNTSRSQSTPEELQSPPTTETVILKFIHQKDTDQRKNRKLEWWEKLASPTKKQWAYANAYLRAEEYACQRGALALKKKQQRRRATRHPPMSKKKPPQTKNLVDPVGSGAGVSQFNSMLSYVNCGTRWLAMVWDWL